MLLTSSKPNLQTQTAPQPEPRSIVRYEAPPLPQQPPQAPVAPTVLPLPNQQVPPLPGQQAGPAPAPAPRPQPRLLVYSSGNNGGGSGAGAAAGGGLGGAPGGTGMLPAGFQGGPGGYGSMGFPGGPGGQGQQGEESLASRLSPTRLSGVSANVLRNQPYLLTTGTLLPCVLQTAMDSTLPGFVTCVIPQDILGKTGLTLLDRGTKVVGQFQGGVRQGVERMFVVWTRAETPQGVVINLDSPATDPLGRAGLDGEVDRHFWQRFGGALLLSVVDGALQAGQAAVAKEGTVTVNTSNTSGVIGESLRGTVNIPPTIRKNQGELVSIFIARDLDFASVYRVTPTPPRYASPVGGQPAFRP